MKQSTTVTHMLSDPMWVLSENIVVDNIIKKVAEEPLEAGANMEDVAIKSIPRRQSKKMKMREWGTPIERKL